MQKEAEIQSKVKKEKYKMTDYIQIFKVIMYFIIYSFLGWILESVYKTILEKKWINSGFLYGPFCPIYGFAAVFMFVCLNNFKDNRIILFIIAFLTLSLWEYVAGWLLEKIFHTTYWDYTNKRFNIKGRVCLENSLYWGILGFIFIRYIHPFVVSKIAIMQNNDLILYTSILAIIMLADVITTIVKVNNISINLEKLKDITNNIKERIEELEVKQINKESLQQTIEELKYKQTKIKRRLLRQTNRLKKAFPTMKSDTIEKINEFLKEKKENIRKQK